MAGSAIRVFIVDDHDLVRMGMRLMFSGVVDIEVVGEASSGDEAVSLCPKLKPDVVLMDVKMPGMDILETIEKLHKALPKMRILVVTASLEKTLCPLLFRKGVTGFFSKIDSQEELIKGVHSVYAGRTYVSPSTTQKITFKGGDLILCPFDLLSERELQVVLLLFNGFKVEEISKKLHIRLRTIKTYRVRSFEKLEVKNDVELTLLAKRHGFLKELKHD